MTKYNFFMVLMFFMTLVEVFCNEPDWIIENHAELKEKDFRIGVLLSINVNPSSKAMTVFEDAEAMIEIVSIVADGVDVTSSRSSYDAEGNRRKTVIAQPDTRARLELPYSARFNTWSLYLQPFGNGLYAVVYRIPWDTKQFVVTYRLLTPDGSKSDARSVLVRIR